MARFRPGFVVSDALLVPTMGISRTCGARWSLCHLVSFCCSSRKREPAFFWGSVQTRSGPDLGKVRWFPWPFGPSPRCLSSIHCNQNCANSAENRWLRHVLTVDMLGGASDPRFSPTQRLVTGICMICFNHRLAHLEMLHPTAGDPFMGTLHVSPGQRPLDALLGVEPGIWLLASPVLHGGLFGRVTPGGRREIMFSDRAHP